MTKKRELFSTRIEPKWQEMHDKHDDLLSYTRELGIEVGQLAEIREKLKNTAFLYDVDGVLSNIENDDLKISLAFVNLMDNLKIPQGFVTNNPRLSPFDIADKLIRHGYHITPEQLITCGVAASYEALSKITQMGLAPTVTVHGTSPLKQMFKDRGLIHVQKGDEGYPGSAYIAGEFDIPIQPSQEVLDEMEHLGINCPIVIVTNPDKKIHTIEHGPVSCVGEWALQRLRELRTDVIVTGKPELQMFESGLAILCTVFNRAPEEITRIIFTGDTLDTDILGAKRMDEEDTLRKWTAVLVGTGNTDHTQDHSSLPIHHQPHFAIANFRYMLPTVVFGN